MIKKRNISNNFNFTYFSFGHPLIMAINATFVKRSLKSICSSSCGNRGILGHDAHIISERERKHFYQQKKKQYNLLNSMSLSVLEHMIEIILANDKQDIKYKKSAIKTENI